MAFWNRSREYRITPDRDEWAAPEETLVDASSQLSDIEMPVSETIWRASYIISSLLALVLLGGTWWLAVAHHTDLAALAFRNRTVNVSVPPPRGLILDRNGNPLVENVPSFDVLVISRQVQHMSDGTIPGIAAIAHALNRDPEEFTLALNDSMRGNAVFFVATDIARDQVLSLSHILPAGFYVLTSTKRQYVDGQQFSHILGYVGKVSRQDMSKDAYYLPSDTIGRLGIEASYEPVLRGMHGQLTFASTIERSQAAPAQAGANVVLQLDTPTQKALWQAIWDILRESGLSQAAAVAQDPRSGAVLAMVSFPTYDNNVFSSALTPADAQQLFSSKERPLFNRAIAGLYNPGSTIKPFIGMAALQEGVVTPQQVVTNDCISLSVPNPRDPTHPYVFDNWRHDVGPFTLNRAIAQSCNIYFFTIGGGYGSINGLGADRIGNYLKKGHADSLLGIDVPGEEKGFIPTPDWKLATKKEPWYQGDTYNISIGQGDLLVTPLWINAYISAIANGGTIWRPMVAQRIVDSQRNTLQVLQPESLGDLPFSQTVIHDMQVAMQETVKTGTAHMFQDIGVTAAAKTGTAEVIKGQRINSLLTVYAPADNPTIAVTVLVEGSAQNQGYALRATRQFLKWFFAPNHDVPTPTISASPSPTPTPTP